MEKLNIYQKLLCISNDLETVAKNLSVGVGKSSYKAVGEADVLRAVKPLEEEYGVYSYPVSRNIVESSVIESVDFNGNVKKQQFMRLEIVYRFVNTENPAEFVDITSYGDGIDSGDKATGKAMTYADKYALMKAYKIITGDDPDQHASEELRAKEAKPVGSSCHVCITWACESLCPKTFFFIGYDTGGEGFNFKVAYRKGRKKIFTFYDNLV